MTKTDFIVTTIIVKFICAKTGRLHGVGETVEGSLVYVPKRLASQLKVGDVIEGKLKPSTDPRSKWRLVEIMGAERNRAPGLTIYETPNIVPRQPRAPGAANESTNL